MAGEESALDTVAEADKTPAKRAHRWLLEIKLAKKREKEWRIEGEEVLVKYRGKQKKKNTFNILWSNTEVLRPALYNSPPKPDVRRRFRQSDILGKAVSELMERGISYCADAYDLDHCIKASVLDGLLPGRGIDRVRYVPKFKESQASAAQGAQAATPADQGDASSSPPPGSTNPAAAEGNTDVTPDDDSAFAGEREEVDYEQALCEHVQWDDFLHGPGKTWDEVEWVAFRHRLRRDDLCEQFGDAVGNKITLNDVADDDVTDKRAGKEVADVFKRAELWEIWDKEGGEVFFVNESYREGVIYALPEEGTDAKQGEPPLKLRNFFPVPRPLMLVEDVGTLIPTPIFRLYQDQADEVDRLTFRINHVVRALKVRGIYDATLGEMSELMKGEDNTLIPAERAAAYMTNGGLEKAIWWMPVEQSAKVLAALYESRDHAKQVIYELTGIADIIRGATDAGETLGAQQIKANSAGLRLQRMQREVQRYVRDLVRLLSEVIGGCFDQATLAQMTGMQFPTAMQKQMIQLQMRTMQQQPAPQPGQPPQPQQAPPQQLQAMQNAMQMPTWEDIMGVLRSDIQREYRVDVETDSTVAEVLQQDMTGLKEVLTGIVQFWQGVAPAVQAGAVNMEAVKAITMSIVRRARMGLEVEDALEAGMQQPKPPPDPNAGRMQEAQIKAKGEQDKIAAESQARTQELQLEAALEKQRNVMEDQRAKNQAQMDAILARFEALLKARTAIEVAEIGAKSAIDQAQIAGAAAATQQATVQ